MEFVTMALMLTLMHTTCTDSDGLDIWTVGYTTGTDEYGGVYMVNDYCTGNVLTEQACRNNQPISIDFDCTQKQATCTTTTYGGHCTTT